MKFEVPFTDQSALAKLAASLLEPSGVADSIGGRKVKLATAARVDQVGGLKIDIFAAEHPPPHFRVSFQGDCANFTIGDCSPMTPGLERFRRQIREWHQEHRSVLIAFWNRTRPTNCPVGEFRE